jgi:hypothetical protein
MWRPGNENIRRTGFLALLWRLALRSRAVSRGPGSFGVWGENAEPQTPSARDERSVIAS